MADITGPGVSTDTDKLREEAYIAGSHAIYGTDYMRGEKDRSYRLARKIIDASGLLDRVEKLQAENQQLRSAVEAAQRLHRQNTGRINACVHCQGTWPCATTRALAAAVVGEPGKAGGE